jgi:hypothetical protein
VTLAAPLVRPVGAALAGGALAGAVPLLRPFNLPSRITYTRTGIATGVTPAGLIYEVAADVPRFDAAGRLIWEGQRSTAYADVRTVGGTGWPPSGLTSPGTTVGPDGAASSAIILNEGTANSAHWTRTLGFSVTNGVSYAANFLVAAGTAATAQIAFLGTGWASTPSANFDLTGAGALGTTNGTLNGTPQITKIGNFYWIRAVAVATANVSTARVYLSMTDSLSATSIPTYTGTSRTLIASWGWIETGSTFGSTPVLPPAGAPALATRGTDTGIFSLFGGAGTIAFSAVPGQAAPAGVDQTLYSINDGTDANRLSIVNVAGGNSIVLRRVVGGAVTDSAAIGTQTPGTLLRGVLTWSGTTASAKLQGGTWRTQTSTSGGFTLGRQGNIIAGTSALFGVFGWGDLLPRSVSEAEADAIMARIPA